MNEKTKVVEYDQETADAILESIRHWRDLREGRNKDYSSDSCPLCQKFLRHSECTECPIKIYVGKDQCKMTPYVDYRREQTKDNAQKEIDFLFDVYVHYISGKKRLTQKWVDITKEIVWNAHLYEQPDDSYAYWILGSYRGDKDFIYFTGTKIKLNHPKWEESYRIDDVHNSNFIVPDSFRVMRKI